MVCVKLTPSSRSAARLLEGEPEAVADVLAHLVGRAVLIGVGLAVAGERDALVRNSIAASAAIEVALLVYQASDFEPDALDGIWK